MTVILIGHKQKVAAEVEIDRNGNLSVLVKLNPRLPNNPLSLTTSQKVAILVADRIKKAIAGLLHEATSRAEGDPYERFRDRREQNSGERPNVADPRGDVPAAVFEPWAGGGEAVGAVDGDDFAGDVGGDR